MKWIFNTGNILIIGSVITLLFIFSLIFSFIKEDLLLVTQNYYEEEKTYDLQKQHISNADRYGDQIRAEKKGNTIYLTIPNTIAKDIRSGQIMAYFPSAPENDQVFSLSKNDSGLYQFEIANNKNVPFTVKVKFSDSQLSYYKIIHL